MTQRNAQGSKLREIVEEEKDFKDDDGTSSSDSVSVKSDLS